MIIITDILKEPLDEGAKVATLNLIGHIKKLAGANIIAINADSRLPFIDDHFRINRLLFDLSFYRAIRMLQWQQLLYIPEASLTLLSFVRARLLRLFTNKNIYILSLQPRKYGLLSRLIIRAISTESVITQSHNTARYLSDLGIASNILPLGVDNKKYHEFDAFKKKELRNKYKLAQDQKVLLHVGHIQQSRNLEWLVNIKQKCSDIEIIMVGSSYNPDNEALYTHLTKEGIRVIRDFIPDMENIYNIADYYIFPVQRIDGAIGTPLSVLEALSCNLPVITTRFGSLPDVFQEDDCFHYVDTVDEIMGILRQGETCSCNNRNKILSFTWEQVARQLVGIIN